MVGWRYWLNRSFKLGAARVGVAFAKVNMLF